MDFGQVFFFDFFQISQNTICYRAPLVAASEPYFMQSASFLDMLFKEEENVGSTIQATDS